MTGQGLRRSVRLFRAFLVEPTDPDRFYGELARDSADLVERVMPLDGLLVIDVGAGPVEFAREFRRRGARYVAVDLDPDVPALADGGVAADAARLPFATGTVDLVFSSNLLEHVRDPELIASELVRIARPGGLVFLSYTNWWSPWGGHETSPWHWLGGRRADRGGAATVPAAMGCVDRSGPDRPRGPVVELVAPAGAPGRSGCADIGEHVLKSVISL